MILLYVRANLVNKSQFRQVLHSTSDASQDMNKLHEGEMPGIFLQQVVEGALGGVLDTDHQFGALDHCAMQHLHVRVIELRHDGRLDASAANTLRVGVVNGLYQNSATLIISSVQSGTRHLLATGRLGRFEAIFWNTQKSIQLFQKWLPFLN